MTGSGQGVDALIRDVADRTPAALDEVVAKLPSGFPAQLADAILGGIEAAIGRLGSAAASSGLEAVSLRRRGP